MLTLIVQLMIEGMGMGLVFVLLAAGLVLILQIPRVFFIAYGQFYMLGAYTVWWGTITLKLPFFVSLFLSVLATFILGAISYRLIFYYTQRLRNNFMPVVVAAMGVMIIMQQGALLLFGPSSRGMPSEFPGMLKAGSILISVEKLVLICLALLVTWILYLVLQKTKVGMAMRAISFRADVSRLQGINPTIIYMVTMGIGCGLAGFAGAIMAPVYAISPDMGGIILTVLLVILLGGMGSMLGAVLGGLILGMTLSFGHYFIGADLAQIAFFMVMGVILFFRPGGLFGQTEDELFS